MVNDFGDIAVLGYLAVDVVVQASDFTSQVDVTDGRVELHPGGSGTNVAAWLHAVGCPTQLLGVTGRDQAAEMLLGALRATGLRVRVAQAGRTTTIVSLVSADGGRRLVTDVGGPFSELPLPKPAGRVGWVHVPAFLLYRQDLLVQSVDFLGQVSTDASLSIDVNSAGRVREFGTSRFLALIRTLRPQVLMMNEPESREFSSLEDVAEHVGTLVVHRGERSTLVWSASEVFEVADGIQRGLVVLDTTGAGDAFAAGFLAATRSGLGVRAAVGYAHALAQQVVGHLGAQPLPAIQGGSLSP